MFSDFEDMCTIVFEYFLQVIKSMQTEFLAFIYKFESQIEYINFLGELLYLFGSSCVIGEYFLLLLDIVGQISDILEDLLFECLFLLFGSMI